MDNQVKVDQSQKPKISWVCLGVYVVVSIVLLTADLLSKHFIAAAYNLGDSFRIIPGFIGGHYTRNDGMAFGWFSGGRWWLIGISILILVIGMIAYLLHTKFFRKKKHWLMHAGAALFLAGALGNLVDRIFLGYVRDFIRFDFWSGFPIFNLADVFINISVIVIIIYIIFIDRGNNDKSDDNKT